MQNHLPGMGVLITGGAKGIGLAMAKTCLAAGAYVHICDKDEQAVSEFLKANPSASATLADVSLEADVDRVMSDAQTKLNSLDVLVNNVGAFGPTKPIEQVTTSEWMECFDVSLHSAFYFVRHVVPIFKRQKSGVIINISSVAAQLGNPLRSPLSVSKAALEGMTVTLAMELGPDGIRVNTIVPGLVDGQGVRNLIALKAEEFGISEEACIERFTSKSSLRAMVREQDIADMVVFLAGKSGEHISGQRISICANLETTRA